MLVRRRRSRRRERLLGRTTSSSCALPVTQNSSAGGRRTPPRDRGVNDRGTVPMIPSRRSPKDEASSNVCGVLSLEKPAISATVDDKRPRPFHVSFCGGHSSSFSRGSHCATHRRYPSVPERASINTMRRGFPRDGALLESIIKTHCTRAGLGARFVWAVQFF
jgi:hypothetical protein